MMGPNPFVLDTVQAHNNKTFAPFPPFVEHESFDINSITPLQGNLFYQ